MRNCFYKVEGYDGWTNPAKQVSRETGWWTAAAMEVADQYML